jgi:hypothetical protein
MVSIGSVICTSSSAAKRHGQAQTDGNYVFRKIGAGACGAIFAQDGNPIVVKLAKANPEELWNDYLMHTLIATELNRYINGINIPACYFFVPGDHTQFFNQYPALTSAASEVVNFPTSALLTERILPLPSVLRQKLVQKYCAERIQNRAMGESSNQDCLVRLIWGL